ncbi:hypothetical protein [Flavisolibacter nicotianae]|uniref:hypothetical protein n=1 Tax=Flavisolibacter nicotianae TaxID=2364882 RepID=UPI000EB4C481|nr:hypothetical protein [Flavisolibacter nicotianae]
MKLGKGLLTLFIFFSCRLFAQTADEIIAKHVNAIGGLDAWKKVQTMKVAGVIDNNGTEINLDMVVDHNKGAKQTIYVAGLQGYTIVTPTTGWRFYPWQGQMKPEALTPEDVKESQDDIDAQTPLIDYKAKGHTAEYVGMDEFEGTDCYKIKLTEKGGKLITYYIDPSNYFIIHSITITKANGMENENKSSFSNYQKLPEGIWMPMKIDNLKFKSVQVNIPVDENTFKPSTN